MRNLLSGAQRMKVGTNNMNMNWLGKIRPQVFSAIVLLGIMGLYALHNGSYEAATGFGALVAMLAKEVIASDD